MSLTVCCLFSIMINYVASWTVCLLLPPFSAFGRRVFLLYCTLNILTSLGCLWLVLGPLTCWAYTLCPELPTILFCCVSAESVRQFLSASVKLLIKMLKRVLMCVYGHTYTLYTCIDTITCVCMYVCQGEKMTKIYVPETLNLMTPRSPGDKKYGS